MAITAVFALLVGATTTFAWLNGEVEQDHRNAEIAAGELLSPQQGLAAASEADETTASEDSGEGSTPPDEQGAGGEEPAPAPAEQDTALDGAALFSEQGCGGCHALEDAGTTATTGPPLDAALKGKDAVFIETAIADPNAVVAEGYPPDVMPQNYGTALSPEQLDALVKYLLQATGS